MQLRSLATLWMVAAVVAVGCGDGGAPNALGPGEDDRPPPAHDPPPNPFDSPSDDPDRPPISGDQIPPVDPDAPPSTEPPTPTTGDLCTRVCALFAGRGCPLGPCRNDCEDVEDSGCAAEILALVTCYARGSEFTCDLEDADFENCPAEAAAVVQCQNPDEPPGGGGGQGGFQD